MNELNIYVKIYIKGTREALFTIRISKNPPQSFVTGRVIKYIVIYLFSGVLCGTLGQSYILGFITKERL